MNIKNISANVRIVRYDSPFDTRYDVRVEIRKDGNWETHWETTKRDFKSIAMGEVCLACGDTFGMHQQFNCRNGGKTKFFSQVDLQADISGVEDVDLYTRLPKPSIMPVGPRKPVPVIPPEIHSTKEFDSIAAWEAVKALSKGS